MTRVAEEGFNGGRRPVGSGGEDVDASLVVGVCACACASCAWSMLTSENSKNSSPDAMLDSGSRNMHHGVLVGHEMLFAYDVTTQL